MVKMSSGLLSLKWNHHRSTFLHVLANIRQKESYSDVTLACAGKFYPTHKLVLSTCSEYFEEMFERTQCKHPVIVLKDIGADDLEALLSYMYDGEVNVLQENLSSLIKAAECLKIKGLAVADNDPNDRTKEKKLHSSSSNSGTNISSNNNRDVQRNDRRPVNSNGSGIKRSNVNSGSGDDGAQLAKRRRPEVRSQLSTSTPPEEGEAAAPAEDVPSDAAGAADSGAEGGSSDKADSDVPPDVQGSTELPEDSQSFIQGLNAEAGVKAEPVEVLDELGFDDRDDAEDSGAGVGPASTDLPDFTEEKFSGGEGEDPALWSGGDAPDLFSQPSTSNFGEDESNNDHGGGGKSGNTSSSVRRPSSKATLRPSGSTIAKADVSAPATCYVTEQHKTSRDEARLFSWALQPAADSANFPSLGLLSGAAAASAAGSALDFIAGDGAGAQGDLYFCSQCSYSTDSLQDFQMHMMTLHAQNATYIYCPYCEYKTYRARKEHLVIHIRRHTGEKPYSCQNCSKAFASKSDLTVHEKLHSGEKDFKCTYCDYRAYRKASIRMHSMNIHGRE